MHTLLARRTVLLIRSRFKALLLTVLAIQITEFRRLTSGDISAMLASGIDTYSLLCLAFPFIFMAGVVSGDFRTGVARLWLQKPVDPVRFYLCRFAERFLVALACALLTLGAIRLGTVALGAPDEVGLLLGRLPYVLVLACVTFGFSCWISRGSTLVAIGFLSAGAVAHQVAWPGQLGRPWNWLFEAILVPIPAIGEFRDFLVGVSDAVWIPLAQILTYSVGWTGLGALGVWYTVNKGRLPHAEQS